MNLDDDGKVFFGLALAVLSIASNDSVDWALDRIVDILANR